MRRKNRPNGVSKATVFTVLVILTGVCAALYFTTNRSAASTGGAHAAAAVFDDAASPFLRVAGWPGRFIEARRQDWAERSQAVERLRALEERVAELEDAERRARIMEARLKRYEALLNVRSWDEPDAVTAWSVAGAGGVFTKARLADAGAREGVEVNDIAVSRSGLVGRVISVGAVSSRVLELTDAQSRVPVFIERTGAAAIMAGDGSLYPKLEFLTDDAMGVQPGDRLITSGDGGVFPFGLEVGEAVLDAESNVTVDLYAGRGGEELLRLIKPHLIPAPEADGGEAFAEAGAGGGAAR